MHLRDGTCDDNRVLWRDAVEQKRGYGAYISLETSMGDGADLQSRIRPLIDAVFDAVE